MGNGDGMVAWLGIGDLFSSPSGFIIIGFSLGYLSNRLVVMSASQPH